MNQSINDGGDCRTAPATPGLLKTGMARTSGMSIGHDGPNKDEHLPDNGGDVALSNSVVELLLGNIQVVDICGVVLGVVDLVE